MNNLSAAGVVEAAKLVKTGKTYSLALTLSRDTPAYGTRSFQLVAMPSGDGSGMTLGTNKATGNDDMVVTYLGIGTQIDGLGHLGIDHRYYNGVPVADFFRPDGLTQFGTDQIPPIATRGVLLDAAAYKGVAQLAPGTALGRADLEAIAKKEGVALRKGDVVLLHTGWLAMADRDKKEFLAAPPSWPRTRPTSSCSCSASPSSRVPSRLPSIRSPFARSRMHR